jgi:hypothetical protein
LSPAQKLHEVSQRLTKAVNKPHEDALLDSLLYLNGDKTSQAEKFAEFVMSLAHDNYVNVTNLPGFSSEVRGWCLSWVAAFMRGEIKNYAEQILQIQSDWLVEKQWRQ